LPVGGAGGVDNTFGLRGDAFASWIRKEDTINQIARLGRYISFKNCNILTNYNNFHSSLLNASTH
jgi:hypothetical protein